MRRNIILSALAMFGGDAAAETWSVAGPGGNVRVELRSMEGGGIQYRVLHGADEPVVAIGWSELGVVTALTHDFELDVTRSDFTSTISVDGAARSEGRETYRMLTGKRRENDTPWRQLTLNVTDDETKRKLAIDVRVFPTGMGVRYRLPEESPLFHELVEDATSFNIGEGGTHIGAPYDRYTMYNPSYETAYDPRPTGTSVTPPQTGWGFPSLFSIRGRHILIHETDVGRDDQGWHLEPEAPKGVYRVAPPLAVEAQGHGKATASSTLPWSMPWRFAVISEDYADIVESNMVFDLAAPSAVEDDSWIRPGVASWNWLSDHDSGADVEKLKPYIDIAAELDLPYTLIDANWNKAGETAMRELVAYARERGVDLFFWYNSGGRHNVVSEEPRNRLDDPARRRKEFAMLQRMGVKGVKVDFWQSDKQDIIALYHDVMRDAAEFNLLTNFHGSTIPRGWQRTYPNLMTMEAVMGAEFYSFGGDYGEFAPVQNTIHPFVRNVIGSMDYTPVLFSKFATPRFTTNAHELALAVVFESGVLHLGDNKSGYDRLPAAWREFLSNVPTAWDETKFLAGAPGDFVVLARRRGDVWYVAGVNGKKEPRSVELDLSGLEGLAGTGVLLSDADDDGFGSEDIPLGGKLSLTMRPLGGFVVVAGAS
ncbi:MAG: glycoside hydrolase family 97 protein [Amphiplicatus sp.]